MDVFNLHSLVMLVFQPQKHSLGFQNFNLGLFQDLEVRFLNVHLSVSAGLTSYCGIANFNLTMNYLENR